MKNLQGHMIAIDNFLKNLWVWVYRENKLGEKSIFHIVYQNKKDQVIEYFNDCCETADQIKSLLYGKIEDLKGTHEGLLIKRKKPTTTLGLESNYRFIKGIEKETREFLERINFTMGAILYGRLPSEKITPSIFNYEGEDPDHKIAFLKHLNLVLQAIIKREAKTLMALEIEAKQFKEEIMEQGLM